jgi:hypothetical protein
MRRRVEEILRIRLDGAEWWDCCEFVREKEQEPGSAWHLADGDKPLSEASLRRYLAKADQLIAESCRASRKKLLRRHQAQRRNLYAKAVSAGDYRTALAVLKDEAELQGLYAPKKYERSGPGGQPLRVTLEDLAAADRKLEEWQRAGEQSEHGAQSRPDAAGS